MTSPTRLIHMFHHAGASEMGVMVLALVPTVGGADCVVADELGNAHVCDPDQDGTKIKAKASLADGGAK